MSPEPQITEEEPTLDELIELIAEAALDKRHGPMLAEVQTYNQATQTCSCRPLVRFFSADGLALPAPILQGIPVSWPASGGATATSALTLPLAPGDIVELTPQAIDHSTWIGSGQADQAAPTPRRSQLADIIARVGGRSPAKPLPGTAVAADGVVLMATRIYLGSSAATDFVALASKVLTELQAIQVWANSHTHGNTQPLLGGTSGTPVQAIPPTPMPSPGSVASLKVLSE